MAHLQLLSLLLLSSLGASEPTYLTGNALETFDVMSPEGESYPRALIDEMYERGDFGPKSSNRGRGRSLLDATMDPATVRQMLLKSQAPSGSFRESKRTGKTESRRSKGESIARQMKFEGDMEVNLRVADEEDHANYTQAEARNDMFEDIEPECDPTPPAQLCPTKYNTTAPLWGISLTSGKRVTIVQKFPDLLQQVIFHECLSDSCDIIHGQCRQTFTPYLFLVIPLGPVTLTGQDYVMVESGCACQPKYSRGTPYDYKKDAFLGN